MTHPVLILEPEPRPLPWRKLWWALVPLVAGAGMSLLREVGR